MEAETTTEAVAPSPNKDLIAKGKRTKRQRPNSPVSFTITPPPRNAAADGAAAHLPPRSPTLYATSSEESTTTEEVDTARCLILLSRGPTNFNPNNNRRSDAATTSYGGGGACMYTCKTCNRSFRSFQALGGHRASHTKPKNEKKLSAIFSDEEDFPSPSSSKNRFSPNSLSLQLSSVSTATFSAALPSPRVHECSYCGAEFSSGQALGGHMRKHRGAGPISRSSTNIPEEIAIDEVELEQRKKKKPRNWLSLDLNLPAPDDEREKSPGPNRICPPLINWHD